MQTRIANSSMLCQGASELQHGPLRLVSVDMATPAGLWRLRQEVSAEEAVTSVTTSVEPGRRCWPATPTSAS